MPLRCRCGGGAVIAPESRRSHYVVTVYPSGARKSRHDSLEYLSSVVHDPQHDATMLKNQKVKIKPPKNVQTNARVFFSLFSVENDLTLNLCGNLSAELKVTNLEQIVQFRRGVKSRKVF